MRGKPEIVPVTSHTRAGTAGRAIICPKCYGGAIVYHFAWCAIRCQHCGLDIEKAECYTIQGGENARSE
jgi:uncharacterized protein (DUF983 family)